METARACAWAALAVWAGATACTSKDSLIDEGGSSGMGAQSGGGSAGKGGGAGMHAGAGPNAGSPATVGGSAGAGAPGKGGSSQGGSGGSGASSASGAGGVAAGGAAVGGGSGGDGGSSGAADGGSSGASGAGNGGGGGASGACSEVTVLADCEARTDCHSVFQDPGTCGCGSVGCCAKFSRCADGDQADCEGKSVQCEAPTPFCEEPAYVHSYSGACYEGCVKPKDCAGATPTCTPPDSDGCTCFSNGDCATGTNCYAADCASNTPGVCHAAPPTGCFGDMDCPSGQTCIGGHPAPCGTTVADRLGTCGVEACPDGDCVGVGATCTCLDVDTCVPATGPQGSAQCRNDDGTCYGCKCASPDTPIATPRGDRAIAELARGDLVYSIDGDQIRAVPILRVNRTPVVNHRVLRVTFENGRSIEMTAGHPLADGYPLSVLRPGSELLGGTVASVTSIPYRHDATYDILPDSTSGAYFASGVLIGSTLGHARLTSSTDASHALGR